MPNEYKQVGNKRIQLTDAEQAAIEVQRVAQAASDAAESARLSKRLSKRPKRSEINALKAKANNDNSNAEIKATVKLLIDMMDSVIAFQQVDVDEDA